MITVNVHQAKANLSHYLDLVQQGKRVVVAKRNIPIAEIKPLNKLEPKRILGQSKFKLEVPDSFFDPLPDDIVDSFNSPK